MSLLRTPSTRGPEGQLCPTHSDPAVTDAVTTHAHLPLQRWRDRRASESHEPLSCRIDGREVHATIPETGLTHRIRALFENATRSEHGSQCPLLWRMYLNFW